MDPYEHSEFVQGSSGQKSHLRSVGKDSGIKAHARWNQPERLTFMSACEIAIAEGHRQGKCFTKAGWERVVSLFNDQTGHGWTKQQMRNHWDSMRRDHRRLSELLDCTGVEYDSSSGRIVASDEWWSRKLKENKEYKEFKGKNVSEIYIRYGQLFGDSYDCDRYAVTPSKLCRTGFDVREDSTREDHRDAIPVDVEGSDSSDEVQAGNESSGVHVVDALSGGKRKSSGSTHKGKKKKSSAREISFSVDRASSAAEEVAAKIKTILVPDDKSVMNSIIDELLNTGRLQRRTPLYFYACSLLTRKQNRDLLCVMKDADEKFEYIEWMFYDRHKSVP